MKTAIKFGFVLIVGVVMQTERAGAQVVTNVSSESELLSNALSRVRTNAEKRRPTQRDLQWQSNVVRNAKAPGVWPDPAKKKAVFDHCSNALRTSVETNRLNSQLIGTNSAAVISVVATNLAEISNVLNDSNLRSYLGAGCVAELYRPANYYFLVFWGENGPIRSFEKRTADAQHVIASARFYENGRLAEFATNAADKDGSYRTTELLTLDDDGSVKSYWKQAAE